jgi:hypothetical protein
MPAVAINVPQNQRIIIVRGTRHDGEGLGQPGPLLMKAPPALEEERVADPLWALNAMVVACASVGWKLAQAPMPL